LERFGGTVLPALDRLAAKYEVTPAAIGLAWLKTRPTIVVPLSGVSKVAQLEELLPVAGVELTADEAAELTALTD
jgi:aryl-alcohol dehydrogenase-like predicted oxidoreductase